RVRPVRWPTDKSSPRRGRPHQKRAWPHSRVATKRSDTRRARACRPSIHSLRKHLGPFGFPFVPNLVQNAVDVKVVGEATSPDPVEILRSAVLLLHLCNSGFSRFT